MIKKWSIIDLIKNNTIRYNDKIKCSILKKVRTVANLLSLQYQILNKNKYISIILTLVFTIIYFNTNMYFYNVRNQYNKQNTKQNTLSVYLQTDMQTDINNIVSNVKTIIKIQM